MCQKEWGGLNGSQVGHRIKESSLLFFDCLHAGKTGRGSPWQPQASGSGAAWTLQVLSGLSSESAHPC
jgi:hypothetical protein